MKEPIVGNNKNGCVLSGAFALIICVVVGLIGFIERDFIKYRLRGCQCPTTYLRNGETRVECIGHQGYPKLWPFRQICELIDLGPVPPPSSDF